MARDNNFLLGRGEQLTSRVDVPSGGGTKNPPYSIETAKKRIGAELRTATAAFDALPSDSTPRGQVVALITMHPRYLSKTDFPAELLSAIGLRTVGSRRKEIRPEAWGIAKHPESAVTEQFFVAGEKSLFTRWSTEMDRWPKRTQLAQQLTHIEGVTAFNARDKLKGFPAKQAQRGLVEVIIHNAGRREIVDDFISYARKHQANPILEKRRDLRGLTFVPVEVDFNLAEELAAFSFVRVARPLPVLRPLQPELVRAIGAGDVVLPGEAPLDSSFRAVVFDGGLPDTAVRLLAPWVTYIEPNGIGPPIASLQDHGLAVTGALLFGPIRNPRSLSRPICR